MTLIVFGVYALGLGLFMLFFPRRILRHPRHIRGAQRSLHLRQRHLRDTAGPAAAGGRSPGVVAASTALAFATLHWALHSISHIVDPHHGAGDLIGWLEAGGLVATTVILAIALRASAGGEVRALMRVLVAGATSVPGLAAASRAHRPWS